MVYMKCECDMGVYLGVRERELGLVAVTIECKFKEKRKTVLPV